jgi:hypothetical protein
VWNISFGEIFSHNLQGIFSPDKYPRAINRKEHREEKRYDNEAAFFRIVSRISLA